MLRKSKGEWIDPRKEKRGFRKLGMSCPLYEAHCLGGYDGHYSRPIRSNRYPPGKRRDVYMGAYLIEQDNKDDGDAMGRMMGRNL